MKRKITLIGGNILAFFLLAYPSFCKLSAQTSGVGITNPLKDQTLAGFIDTILAAVIEVGIVVVTGSIIYAGFKYVTARGNTSKIKQAHDGILYTIIGSGIVLGAYVVRQIVMDTITQVLN